MLPGFLPVRLCGMRTHRTHRLASLLR